MREKELKAEALYAVLGVGGAVIFCCLLFLVASLRTELMYQQVRPLPPKLASEKLHYYRNALTIAQQIILLQPDNARNYIKKADYLWGMNTLDAAFRDAGNLREVEDLYSKAVILNPFNYEFHLKLGWFYHSQGVPEKAKKELEAAVGLYPYDYLPHFYASRYFLSRHDELSGFMYLIQALQYRFCCGNTMLEEIITENTHFSAIMIDTARMDTVKYTFQTSSYVFDLKLQGFPRVAIPLRLIVYTRGPAHVALYYGRLLYRSFKQQYAADGRYVYEVALETFPSHHYLDDFIVMTDPLVVIEKVECIYKKIY